MKNSNVGPFILCDKCTNQANVQCTSCNTNKSVTYCYECDTIVHKLNSTLHSRSLIDYKFKHESPKQSKPSNISNLERLSPQFNMPTQYKTTPALTKEDLNTNNENSNLVESAKILEDQELKINHSKELCERTISTIESKVS